MNLTKRYSKIFGTHDYSSEARELYLNSTLLYIRHFYLHLYELQSQNSFRFNCLIRKCYYFFFVIESNAKVLNAKDDGIESRTNRELSLFFRFAVIRFSTFNKTDSYKPLKQTTSHSTYLRKEATAEKCVF